MTVNIMGFEVVKTSISECISEIDASIVSKDGVCRWLACINPHSYAISKYDDRFEEALKSSNWLVPDGVGVIYAARALGDPLSERITGFDIFDGVMRKLEARKGSVFFLGSTDKTLKLIAERLRKDYPNVTLAGVYSPPFKETFSCSDNDVMISRISNACPDVLWVGMTAPKQEKWIYENRHRLSVEFAGAIGAVFDFYSGQVKRSHPFFQKMGLEWLPRLIQQPKRLWRRMAISAPIFLWDVFTSSLRR